MCGVEWLGLVFEVGDFIEFVLGELNIWINVLRNVDNVMVLNERCLIGMFYR